MKTCSKCKETKDLSEFWKDRSTRDGLQCQCRVCHSSYKNERTKARRLFLERERNRLDPTKRKNNKLKHKYGIDILRFEEMVAEQDNCCAICNEEFTKTPHVDHCHESGEVRGLLCMYCNTGLGKFRDDPERLSNAITYLERTHIK